MGMHYKATTHLDHDSVNTGHIRQRTILEHNGFTELFGVFSPLSHNHSIQYIYPSQYTKSQSKLTNHDYSEVTVQGQCNNAPQLMECKSYIPIKLSKMSSELTKSVPQKSRLRVKKYR